jgi:hypothetical protein
MKKSFLHIYILVLVFVLPAMVGTLKAQEVSDFQLVRNYQTEYLSILNEIKDLESVAEAQELMQRINRLNNQYGNNRELINRFIHPEDFDGQLFSLRELTTAAQRNLQRLADRDAEIERLNLRISDLSSRLDRFTMRSDSLQQALDRMTRDRNANAAQVRNLRNQLSEYDEFILGLVDSIFVAYDNLDLSSLSPSERREFALRADKDNVTGHINTVVENNIAFIDTHSQLSSADLLKLKATHADFRNSWGNLGNKLARIYENEREREAKVQEVNEKISTWGNRLDQALWRSLNASIQVRGIDLPGFSSPSSFYNALVTYIDDAIERTSDKRSNAEELEKYENFSAMWHNDMKANWQEFLIEGEVLSYQNIATIDRKLTEWNLNAQVPGFNWLIVVALLGLLVLVLIVVLITRSKSDKPAPAGA